MHFTNETNLTAGLLRSERPDDRLVAAMITRARYRLPDVARLYESASEPPSLRMELTDLGEYGTLLPDDVMPRTGTDVIVLGDAVSTDPTLAIRVAVQVGPYDLVFDAVGDREWEGSTDSLVPSAPRPFTRMPLTWSRAFGGAAKAEYGPIPWYMNPLGRGYYLKAADARGRPLPNLESCVAPVQRWDDRPDPVGPGPYPADWGLRTAKTIRVDVERERIEIEPEGGLFDRAYPLLSGAQVQGGATMTLKGMTVGSAMTFTLPSCPCEVEINVGGGTMVRPLALEEILVDLRAEVAGAPWVELTWRKMFSYKFVPFQQREVRLRPVTHGGSNG